MRKRNPGAETPENTTPPPTPAKAPQKPGKRSRPWCGELGDAELVTFYGTKPTLQLTPSPPQTDKPGCKKNCSTPQPDCKSPLQDKSNQYNAGEYSPADPQYIEMNDGRRVLKNAHLYRGSPSPSKLGSFDVNDPRFPRTGWSYMVVCDKCNFDNKSIYPKKCTCAK